MSILVNIPSTKVIAERIAKTNSFRALKVIAENIRRFIDDGKCASEFEALFEQAAHKAKVVRVLERCPAPANNTMLEHMAFESCVEGCATLDTAPSVRVVHYQLKKLGYAKTAARQVERAVGGTMYQKLVERGAVRFSSEYFVFKYAEHLVSAETYAKVKALFEQDFAWGV